MARKLIPSAYVTFDKTAGTVSFNGNHNKESILLITDVTAMKTLYQFNSRNFMGSVFFDEATEKTIVTLDYDTNGDPEIGVADVMQVFVDEAEVAITVAEDLLDGVGKIRVSNPGNLIDTDFEYGLQSTKWETLQSVNNIPTVYSSSGDKPIDGVISVESVAGSKQVKVTTDVPHNLELGSPVSVQGVDDYQAEGYFTISGVDGDYAFFFELDVPATTTGDISGGYTTIVPAKFFEGSPLPVSIVDGAQTDGGAPSRISVTTQETHGFALGTKVYLRNTIGPKSLVIADPQATAPDGRPYVDSQSVFTTNIDISANEDTGRGGVRKAKTVAYDWQSTYTHYIDSDEVDTVNNRLTWNGHGLRDKYTLIFNTPYQDGVDCGLTDGDVFWVKVIDANTIELYENKALTTIATLGAYDGSKGQPRLGLVYEIGALYRRYDMVHTRFAEEVLHAAAATGKTRGYLTRTQSSTATYNFPVDNLFTGMTTKIAAGARVYLDYILYDGDFDNANEWFDITVAGTTNRIGDAPNQADSTFYYVADESSSVYHGLPTDASGRPTGLDVTDYVNASGDVPVTFTESVVSGTATVTAAAWIFIWRIEEPDNARGTYITDQTLLNNSGSDFYLLDNKWGLGGISPDRVIAFQGRRKGVAHTPTTNTATFLSATTYTDTLAAAANSDLARSGVVNPDKVYGATKALSSSRSYVHGYFRVGHDYGNGYTWDRLSDSSEVFYMFATQLSADKNTVYEEQHGIPTGQIAQISIPDAEWNAGQRFKFADSTGVQTTVALQSFEATINVVSPNLFRIALNVAPNTDDITQFPDNFSVTYNTENSLYNTIYVNNHKIISQSQADYLVSGLNEPATVVYTATINGSNAFVTNGENIGENAVNPTVRMYENQAYEVDISGLTGVDPADRPTIWYSSGGAWTEATTEYAMVIDDATDADIRTITFTASGTTGDDIAISVDAPDSEYATGGTDENFIYFESTPVSTGIQGITNDTTYNLNRVTDSRLTLTEVVSAVNTATTTAVGAANNNTITQFVNIETPLGITPTGASITAVQYRGNFAQTSEYVKITFDDGSSYFIGQIGGANTSAFRNDSRWVTKNVTDILVDSGGFLGVNVEFDPTSQVNLQGKPASMTNWWEIRFVVTGGNDTVVLDSTGATGEQEFLLNSIRGAYDGVFAIIAETPSPDEFVLETDFKIPAREYTFTSTNVTDLTEVITFSEEHNLLTGEAVQYIAGAGNNSMLSNGDGIYYAIVINSTTIALAESSESALLNIKAGLTPEPGTHTIKSRNLIKAIKASGLVSGANGSSLLTGSGTSFLTNFKRFDKIYVTGANFAYPLTVNTILSNTQMTVFETLEETLASDEFYYTTQIMLRPDGYSLHKSFDGGVDITAGTSPDSKIVRQSRKYFRYQSGKGIQNSLAINFNPPRIARELITAIGTTARIVTQEQHNLNVGDVVKIGGAEVSGLGLNNPYNGQFYVTAIPDDFSFEYEMSVAPDEAKASGFPTYTRSQWTDSYVRAGMFDDQNGFFFEFDGQVIYAVVRSSTKQLAGSVAATRNSQVVTGVNTSFTTQLNVGGKIVIRGQSYKVVEISSDSRLVIQPAYRGVTAKGIKITKTEDRKVPQSEWNIDKCDGRGPTGFKLDTTKIQMCYADYSWYGAGKVRFGFKDRNGHIKYVHQFIHNNRLDESYFRSGNLPGRYEIENGPNATTAPTLFHFGTSIIMDGRFDDDKAYLFSRNSKPFAFTNGANRTFNTNAISTFETITLNGKRVFVYALPCALADASATVVGSQISQGSTFPAGTYVTQVKLDGATSIVYTSYPATNTEPAMPTIASGITITNGEVTAIDLAQPLPLVSLRLSPSVDSALTGAIGEREIINRMQLRLRQAGITSNTDIEVFLILNAIPSNASFQGAESPSLSQIIDHNHGDTLYGGTTIYSVKGSAGSLDIDLSELLELGNSILGGDGVFPNGPDLLTLAVQPQSTAGISGTAPFFVSGKISWSESQA